MAEKPNEPLRLLTITAHPHDITYTLGTNAHHIDRGDSVTVVSLTDGATTHDEELEEELRRPPEERRREVLDRPRDSKSATKQAELERVCAIFGITDVRMMPFTDNPIPRSPEIRAALDALLHEIRPHVIMTHAPYNYPHGGRYSLLEHDHAIAGVLVEEATQRIERPDPNREHSTHRVGQTFYIGVEFGWTDIDVFVDIGDQVANRIKAEAVYESQGHTSELARKRIEAFCGYFGWFGGAGYAEPFIRAKAQQTTHLPLTDLEISTSKLTEREEIERKGYFASGRE